MSLSKIVINGEVFHFNEPTFRAVIEQRAALLAALREAEATLSNAQEHYSPTDTLAIVREAIRSIVTGGRISPSRATRAASLSNC